MVSTYGEINLDSAFLMFMFVISKSPLLLTQHVIKIIKGEKYAHLKSKKTKLAIYFREWKTTKGLNFFFSRER